MKKYIKIPKKSGGKRRSEGHMAHSISCASNSCPPQGHSGTSPRFRNLLVELVFPLFRRLVRVLSDHQVMPGPGENICRLLHMNKITNRLPLVLLRLHRVARPLLFCHDGVLTWICLGLDCDLRHNQRGYAKCLRTVTTFESGFGS